MAKKPDQDEWSESVRDRVDSAMRARGLSQRALGDLIGISGSGVAQWMSDHSFDGWWRLKLVSEALGVSADTILGTTGAPDLPPTVDPRRLRRLIKILKRIIKLNESAAAEALKISREADDSKD